MLPAGTRLGPYEIAAPIGAGGMGEVYRAVDTRLGRTVAIKVLPAQLSANSESKERFDREARAISKLNHPNICVLFDVGHQDGIDFIVMEYLDGETLGDVIARGPFPLADVLRVGGEIADALAKAHEEGIVHRDLKPGNIMLTKSGAKILDFGLAKEAALQPPPGRDEPTMKMPLTSAGMILGTLQYMAPEQLEAREADARSDIFAFGAILYEMATGRRAFEGKSSASIIAAIMGQQPSPMSAVAPRIPPALDDLVRRCLAKTPADRVQSANEVRRALHEIRNGIAAVTSAPMPAPDAVVVPPPRKRYALLAAAILVPLLLIAGAGVLYVRKRAGATSVPTVAVLPFAAIGVDPSQSYLAVALPDEVTTLLSNSRNLAVRPFSTSRRFSADVDPQEAAKKLDVNGIVSGHLLAEGGHLSITLEATDVKEDKLLWRDVFESPASDLLSIRRELSSRIETGLMPKLAGGAAAPEPSQPTSEEAYSLYLRATAASTDPQPNKDAMQMLERAVRLDPKFALAWSALAQRSYFDYSFSNGGQPALTRMQDAAQQALSLNPGLVNPAMRLISMRAEDGRIVDAYRDAQALVRRRPDSAESHFAIAYVLRYGGALEESAKECDRAWAIDHGNLVTRSCAIVFMSLGKYDRALDFTRLDAGSEWSNRINANMLLRQGKYQEAASLVSGPRQALIQAAVNHNIPELDRVAALLASKSTTDGEPLYYIGNVVSLGGDPHTALGFLREAIRRNYCSYPAIETDPLWAAARALPEYAQVRASAKQCHETFLAQIAK